MKRIYTPAKPKKILIVDDDETVASAYRDKLQSERFKVEVASSGERALQSLAKEPVDLVILDFSLPGMNGAEILKTIRSQFGATALPIIVFTNFYLPVVVRDASVVGATRCVRKNDCTWDGGDRARGIANRPRFQWQRKTWSGPSPNRANV
jgi:CheY-like chemotaxis protein